MIFFSVGNNAVNVYFEMNFDSKRLFINFVSDESDDNQNLST